MLLLMFLILSVGQWEASGGIGREGWRTLSGGQWRDWQGGVEDIEWRPVEGLAERGGGHCVEPVEGLAERGWEDTEWRPVEGFAGRGGGH
ncbi:unnamed protein product [Staurois parvus]|uniref:Secreted protein n=1 Tax=Staurois parvus TaxID=386267 RepID=A0ABN9G9G2_9NEOB|nr:unnamed protein product [Staurois parvus]